MRGEDERVKAVCMFTVGSPPHAWGRRPKPPGSFSGMRFTPTCVGKTTREEALTEAQEVHPHMRGEDARI